jgi:hypothetical protein
MKSARLIVCEKRGGWAAALRRQWKGRLYETRSLDACWQMISEWPHSFAVLELTPDNCEELIRRLGDLDREYPGAVAVIVTERQLRPWEWLVREAGAAHVTASPRCLGAVSRLASRHIAAAPDLNLSPAQRILASLPWPDAGEPAAFGPRPDENTRSFKDPQENETRGSLHPRND